MEVYRNNNSDGMSIITSIENGELKKNIIRVIAPKFYLNKAIPELQTLKLDNELNN